MARVSRRGPKAVDWLYPYSMFSYDQTKILFFFPFSVSLETLAADVQGLRKGLDLTKSERDKQPNNFIVYVSFVRMSIT